MKTISGWWTRLLPHEKISMVWVAFVGVIAVLLLTGAGAALQAIGFVVSVALVVVTLLAIFTVIIHFLERKS